MASGQGFATNWARFFVSLVTIPANMAAASFLQARLVSGIAHLRGYELSDPRVRTAILYGDARPLRQCRTDLQGRASPRLRWWSRTPGLPRAPRPSGLQGTARPLPQPDDGQAVRCVAGQAHPVRTGGGVGAAVDGWSTRSIALHAMEEFPSRRPKLTRTVVRDRQERTDGDRRRSGTAGGASPQ